MPTVEDVFEDPVDPIPDFPEGLDTDPENDIKNPDELEPGDRVFMTTIQDCHE